MQKIKVSIIGSTGSIGKSGIEVISKFPEIFQVVFLVANSNYKLLAKQAQKVKPEYIVLLKNQYLNALQEECKNLGVRAKIFSAEKDIKELIKIPNQNILIANNGIAALDYILQAITANHNICLANKEAIVSAGALINQQLQTSKSKIIPVDSEHNAIYQILNRNNHQLSDINELIITASGGPFYNLPNNSLKNVTKSDTIKHPTWNMGAEICVNSATLVNKALEIIEAYYLFNVAKNKITAIYHPMSIVHGIISYKDASLIMLAAPHTMQIPIAYALANEQRLDLKSLIIPITEIKQLFFEEIKEEKSTAINIAKAALTVEGNRPCIFNVANERAVYAFLNDKIKFTNIINVIDYTLNKIPYASINQIEDVYVQSELAAKVADEYITLLT